MNPGLVVKLRPSGPWRIGPDSGARNRVDVIYHSDSLYSAVTAAMSRLGWLEEWLDATARTGASAVSFSSCFPYLDDIIFVVPPRTIWPPASTATKAARVRWRSARFVPLTVVQSILTGLRLDENQWSIDGPSDCLVPAGSPGPFRTAVRWSAGVDRLTGATERHSTGCLEFRPGSGLWTVVSFQDDAARARWGDPVKAAFRLLADTGFGGERSRGWGRSEAPEFTDGMLPDLILPLPHETAAATEPEEGAQAAVRAASPVAPMVVTPEPDGDAVKKEAPAVETPSEVLAADAAAAVPAVEPEASVPERAAELSQESGAPVVEPEASAVAAMESESPAKSTSSEGAISEAAAGIPASDAAAVAAFESESPATSTSSEGPTSEAATGTPASDPVAVAAFESESPATASTSSEGSTPEAAAVTPASNAAAVAAMESESPATTSTSSDGSTPEGTAVTPASGAAAVAAFESESPPPGTSFEGSTPEGTAVTPVSDAAALAAMESESLATGTSPEDSTPEAAAPTPATETSREGSTPAVAPFALVPEAAATPALESDSPATDASSEGSTTEAAAATPAIETLSAESTPATAAPAADMSPEVPTPEPEHEAPMKGAPAGEIPAEPAAPQAEAGTTTAVAPAPEPVTQPPVALSPTHPHWLLSLFTPAAADTVDWRRGNYTVLARGGRVESPAGSGELKKQIQMVAEGSVVYAESAPSGSAANVAPDGFAHPVFRAGFALAIPLPEVR